MGSFSRSLANILFGWVSGVISKIWAMINTDSGTALIPWVGKMWLWIVVALCLLGLVTDLVVYAFRWRPHKVWISAFNRIRNKSHKKPEVPLNGNNSAESAYGYATQSTSDGTEQPLPDARFNPDGYPTADETIRYVPERVQRNPSGAGDNPYIGQYERRYTRPEGERHARNEAERNNIRTGDLIAPRRKHAVSTETAGEDESPVMEFRRKRRTAPQIDPAEAYNAPFYPPQWNKKTNTGEDTNNE